MMYNPFPMAKLVIKLNNEVVKEHPLEQGVIFGRETGDVVLKNPAVSAKHARIAIEKTHFILHDLKSTNGTFVNKGRITSQELHHGDIINIGKFEILFINEEEAKTSSDFFGTAEVAGMTVMINSEEMMKQQKAKEEEAKRKSEAAQLLVIMDQSASGSGRLVFHKLDKETTLLGSGDGADIKTPGITIGSIAAAITRRAGKYSMKPMGGFTKPKLNGEKLTGEKDLKNRDRIELGQYQFEFRI